MRDPNGICVIEVGVHPAPYWSSPSVRGPVCSRHRSQIEERDDFKRPFNWQPYDPSDRGEEA